MKTIFYSAIRDELIQRIGLLKEDSKSVWGKMNVYQMAKHCTIWNDWMLGKKKLRLQSRTANSNYLQAGVWCFVGQESGKFEVQFLVGSPALKLPACV